ncbi:MAG: hypothetical protein ACTSRL_20470 [Candidatus Helarchaeota archaeon]
MDNSTTQTAEKVYTGEGKKRGCPKKRIRLDTQSYFYKGVKY